MKSKQKKYIRKHIGKQNIEEIAQKIKLDIEDATEYVSKCYGISLAGNISIESSMPAI